MDTITYNWFFTVLVLTLAPYALNAQALSESLPVYSKFDVLNCSDFERNHYQTYLELSNYNDINSSKAVNKRNNFSYKLDSSYHITLVENNTVQVELKVYFYLEENRDIIYLKSLDELGNYSPESYYVQSYNKDGLLIKHTYNRWMQGDSSWPEDRAIVIRDYFYNEHQQLSEIHEYDFLDIPQEKIDNKTVFNYNENGLLAGYSRFFYNAGVDSLVPTRDVIYRYNLEDLLSSIAEFNVTNSILIPKDSIYFNYNGLGNIIQEESYLWYPDVGFLPYNETITDYNGNESINTVFEYRLYDTITNKWKRLERNYYQYYNSGDLYRIVTTDSIPPPTYSELTYEARYEYDESILFDEVKVHRSWIPSYEQINMLKDESYYFHGYTFENFGLDFRNTYFYSEINPVSVQQISKTKELSLFPNPNNGTLILKSENHSGKIDFRLFDLQGKMVFKTITTTDTPIELPDLQAGIYYYHATLDVKYFRGKLVIID